MQEKGTFKSRMFASYKEPTPEETKERMEDLNDAIEEANELNAQFGGANIGLLADALNEMTWKRMRVRNFFSSLSFHDQILTASTYVRRDDLRGSRRAELREDIEDTATKVTGSPVGLILRWAN